MHFEDHHSYIDFSQSAIKHINLHINVDFPGRILNAKVSYKLDRKSGKSLFLDSSQLDIKTISSEQGEIEWEIDKDDPILGQRLHLKDVDGISEFTIEYSTSPNARALQWTDPVQTAGKVHPFLYSQCQAINARSLFPCQDSPSVRFTYKAEVEVPKPLTAVMGAQLIDTVDQGSSTLFIFEMPQPIPSYLFALAVGNLSFAEIGPRTGVYAEPEVIESAAWEYAQNEDMLMKAEKLLGPYLWDRYDLLIMPPSFPYGGMENPRLTFLSSTAILGDRSYLRLIFHELAHAWTGNLVTNATWEHFWLNEGWTTYAQDRITEVIEGKEKAEVVMSVNTEILRQQIEFYGAESDITRLKTSMRGQDPDASVTQIPYYKGAHFIGKLESAVGRKKFDPFIQKYIAKYQFRSITTEEFLDFLGEELPQAARDVAVQNWVFDPGIPDDDFVAPSAQYDQAMKVLDGFLGGQLPTQKEVANWGQEQKVAFMLGIINQTSKADCINIDKLFKFEDNTNSALLSLFYETCINSGYSEIFPRLEDYVTRVGRGLYIKPIFRAMIKQSWAKKDARRIFEKVKEGYHPLVAGNIEALLFDAGL